MFDTLCLRGLASAETKKEIAPPELITGRGTIKLTSRLVCSACTPLLLLIAIDSPKIFHHLLEIYPGKASERIKHCTLPEHFPKREAPPHLELLQNVRAYTHLWS